MRASRELTKQGGLEFHVCACALTPFCESTKAGTHNQPPAAANRERS